MFTYTILHSSQNSDIAMKQDLKGWYYKLLISLVYINLILFSSHLQIVTSVSRRHFSSLCWLTPSRLLIFLRWYVARAILRFILFICSWETKWTVTWFDCDESLTSQGLNSNPGCFCFSLSLVRLENRVCLSDGVQEVRATWCTTTRTVARVGDLVQRTGDGRTGRVLGCREVERSGGAVCGLHLARGG
jgi:hypothetical protein